MHKSINMYMQAIRYLLFFADVPTCPAENDTNYEISWPSVGANMSATVPCTNAAGSHLYNMI